MKHCDCSTLLCLPYATGKVESDLVVMPVSHHKKNEFMIPKAKKKADMQLEKKPE